MSRTTRLGFFLAFVLLMCIFIPTVSVNALNIPENELIDKIVSTNPCTSKQMVIDSADEMAHRTGKTRQEILQQIVKEIDQNAALRKQTLAEIGVTDTNTKSSNSYQLTRSYYKGDMFLTPAATAGVQHGHIGIYGDKDWIVEAEGPFKLSRWEWHYNIFVPKGTILMETTCSQAQQDAAADYAYNKLVGYPYNPVFWNNKESDPKALNCSQLVWLAYKKAAGVDLDGNGGDGVYPYDIRDSDYTTQNWVIE